MAAPEITLGTSGGNKVLTELYVGTSGGNKQVTEVWVGTSGGNKLVYTSETVSISNLSVTATGFPTQTATYTLESDGDVISTTTDFGSSDQGDWITPKSAAPSDYQVRATVVSGSLSSGTTGSWLVLTSNRSWTRSRATEGVDTCVLTIEIRKGTGSVLSTATITLTAEAFGGGF